MPSSLLRVAQLMAMKSPVRPLALWISRANTSLPVPLSPVSRTFTGYFAILRAVIRAFVKEGVAPTVSPFPVRSASMNEACAPIADTVSKGIVQVETFFLCLLP